MIDLKGEARYGLVALMGSGETSASGGQIFEAVAKSLPDPLRVGVMETPAGFELNSPMVAGRVAEFIKVRLQNYHPDVDLIPARKRGTAFSPDDPDLLAPLLDDQLIFMGPGSPSYVVRQLSGSFAWDLIQSRHRLGAALAFASAAAISLGERALPVYEIYKVGEDPHWKKGLDFFAPFGLNLVVVSHWNNSEGGAELDTSRCFVGRARFDPLLSQLPSDSVVLGLDEQTGLIMDFQARACQVMGRDQIHVLRSGQELTFSRGETFSFETLGDFHLPEDPSEGLRPEAWQSAVDAYEKSLQPEEIEIPQQVAVLVERRQQARTSRDWSGADELRREIAGMGWKVVDTPEGPKVEPIRE